MKSAGESNERSREPSKKAMIATAIKVERETRGVLAERVIDSVDAGDVSAVVAEESACVVDRSGGGVTTGEGSDPGRFIPFPEAGLDEPVDLILKNDSDPWYALK